MPLWPRMDISKSSDIGDDLIVYFSTQPTTSPLTSSNDNVVTFTTQKPLTGQSITPTINWHISTITTNQLPPDVISYNDNTALNSYTWNSDFNPNITTSSRNNSNNTRTDSDYVSLSSQTGFSTYVNSLPTSSVLRYQSRSNFYSTLKSTRSTNLGFVSTSDVSIVPSEKSSTITPSTFPSTITLEPLLDTTNIGKTTTTVIEYYEQLTYTQVYVITGDDTLFTTSILATTSFETDKLSPSYTISPSAITTDVAAFKALYNYQSLSTHHGLAKGAIAGISVGVTLVVLFLLGWIIFLMFKWRKKSEVGFYHEKGVVDDEDLYCHEAFDLENLNNLSRLPPPPPPPPRRSAQKPISTLQIDLEETPPNQSCSTFINSVPITPPVNGLDLLNSLSVTPTEQLFNDNAQSISPDYTMLLKSALSCAPPPPPSRKSSYPPRSHDNPHHNYNKKILEVPKSLGGPPDIRDILRGTPPPPVDRSMDVLYETPCESTSPLKNKLNHNYHLNRNSDLSLIAFEDLDEANPFNTPSKLETSELNLTIDKRSISEPIWRGRAGSFPKRYESLNENVWNLKQTLLKDSNAVTDTMLLIKQEDSSLSDSSI